ncbi:MAG: riboflavin synthase [Actinomycetota bacterium]|nr:riboflavin synthase [Actinomycetota bacterium]
MFTGIIEEMGEVVEVQACGDCAVLVVRADRVSRDLSHGASIAVNGVCLTVTDSTAAPAGMDIRFDVMAETLNRSVIGNLKAGEKVNLERAVRVDSRLDGHVVQGHVDGTGVVISRTSAPAWDSVRVGLPGQLSRLVAEKGSIAIEGVSLTVTAVGPDWFEVGLIPETLRATTLGLKRPGDRVNLEVDVLAKYVERLLMTRAAN